MTQNVIIVILLLFFVSCREEIVSPENPVSNKNEPVQIKEYNSYTFLIDADNITYSLLEYPAFSASTSKVLLSISEYKGGSVEVQLNGSQNRVMHKKVYNKNFEPQSYDFSGESPSEVLLNFNTFSGQFRLKIYK